MCHLERSEAESKDLLRGLVETRNYKISPRGLTALVEMTKRVAWMPSDDGKANERDDTFAGPKKVYNRFIILT